MNFALTEEETAELEWLLEGRLHEMRRNGEAEGNETFLHLTSAFAKFRLANLATNTH